MPGKKGYGTPFLSLLPPGKNFQNGVPARSVTKIPLIASMVN
jgi:hypothetical protein